MIEMQAAQLYALWMLHARPSRSLPAPIADTSSRDTIEVSTLPPRRDSIGSRSVDVVTGLATGREPRVSLLWPLGRAGAERRAY